MKWYEEAFLKCSDVVSTSFIGRRFNRSPKLDLSGTEKTKIIPTVMMHGTNGTRRSLGSMIKRLTKMKKAKKVMDIEVSKQGEITLIGDLDYYNNGPAPLIQVIFKEGNPTEWQQGMWLNSVLTKLQEEYGVVEVDFVGHSMGGITGLRYIVDHAHDLRNVQIRKLVCIGSPFNSEVVHESGVTKYDCDDKGPRHLHETYRYLQTYQEHFSKKIRILNIYGDLKNGSRSDGVVSTSSARALKHLVDGKVGCYLEREIKGWRAQHSLLHENRQVDDLVAQFLWRK